MSELLLSTQEYLDKTNIDKRKSLGQYFTVSSVRNELMKLLPKMKNPRVLEPSCGTGEFLKSIYDYFESPQVDAYDIDSDVVKISKINFPKSNIKKANTLELEFNPLYDFVIGNPPYFEFEPSEDISQKYSDVISGRANIYSLFIKLGLEMLKPGGYLAYVIPPSMNNGAYFSNLRKYIISNSNIENITLLDSNHFKDAEQGVMILVLKKGENSGNYIFKKDDILIFTTKAEYLYRQFVGRKSLKELGFVVKTGNVVWNQKKDLLTDDKSNTLLIWAHNINDDGFCFGNKNKKQYIKLQGRKDKAIVVNRIIGLGENASIRAMIVNGRKPWLAENHVNVIQQIEKSGISLEDVCEQLTSKRALNVIKSISGNTQLSKKELENLIPINLTKKEDEK